MSDKTCDTCRWYGLKLETPNIGLVWACMDDERDTDLVDCDQSCDRWERKERLEQKQTDSDKERYPDFKTFFEAIKLCREHANGKIGVVGTVKCPKCGGNLHYSTDACNGHLWGKCETQGCLLWME